MRYLLALCAASVLFAAGPLSNRRAPGFSLMDTKGQQHDLYDYRGKIVLVEIMQTKCPHCRTFSKILDRAKAKYGDRIAILSVVNPPDTAETVSRYMAEVKPSTPLLFDCGQMAISYFKASPQNPSVDLPHLFIINPDGWIVDDYGYDFTTRRIFEGEGLFPILDKLLAAKPAKK
ncbi:MAG TPA: TlpA disulfide reductase family protein [Bryobacteraceae bacterium]|nr:TlpA disulfide reductase family protein [Bryobacteraceae bacterium]